MRLKLEPEGAPGPLSTLSENFFAGIEVRKKRLERDYSPLLVLGVINNIRFL